MNGTEVILKVIELSLTILGLILVVFGWIVPYRQSVKEEIKRKKFEEDIMKRQWEKEMVDKQISEFYGPIASLLREQDVRFTLILYQLGRGHVFEKDKMALSDLPENEQKIWVHFVDTYKLPTQQKILEIMQKNQHLVYKSEVPTAFKLFREYSLGWEMLDNQKRSGVSNYYEYYYSFNYPTSFSKYIFETLDVLLKIQTELIMCKEYPSTVY